MEQLPYSTLVPGEVAHHFKSDLINNMDHMRISGNELVKSVS